MSEVEESLEEPGANLYNAKKPWHKPDGPPMQSADSLFYEQQATPQEAPDEEEKESPKRKRTNYKKRYDDLKKHYDNRVSQFKQREGELLAETRAAQPQYKAPKSFEDLEKFREEYPDLYETVETVAHLQSERQVEELKGQLSAIQQREADIMRREAETELRIRHPDFEDIRGDDSFREWAKGQPEEIQEWIFRNPDNVELASKAIDLYKLENGFDTSQPRRQSRQSQQPKKGSAADLVSTKTTTVGAAQSPRIWTEREISAMSLDEFDALEEEINQAVTEGRVVKS
jgi:FtsZ-binding cell division protein ZapB